MMRWLSQWWFERGQLALLYPYALETTLAVDPGTMPGIHRSYVSKKGTRLWAFATASDREMARRVAGKDVVR